MSLDSKKSIALTHTHEFPTFQLVFITSVLGTYIPFYIDTMINFKIRRISMIILIGLLLIYTFLNREVYISIGSLYLISLFIILISSMLWTTSPVDTFGKLFDISFFMVFSILFVCSRDEKIINLTRWWEIFLVFSIINTALATLFVWDIFQFGDFVGPNQVARYSVVSLPIISSAIMLAGGLRKKCFFFTLLVYNILLIISTGSRSGILVLFTVVFFIIITAKMGKEYPQKKLSEHVKILLQFIFITSTMSIILLVWLDGINTPVYDLQAEKIGPSRFQMYSIAISTLQTSWLFGVGFGAFPKIMAEYWPKGFIIHNIILRLWVGVGIFGPILFVKTVLISTSGYFTHDSDTDERKSVALLISFIGMVLMGLFNPILEDPLFYLFICIGITNGSYRTQ